MWNLRTDRGEQFVPQAGASIQCVAVDQRGKRAAAVTNKGTCHAWDIFVPPPPATDTPAEGGPVAVPAAPRPTAFRAPGQCIPAHSRYALKCKFSPDSSMLATSSADQVQRLLGIRWSYSFFNLFLFVDYQDLASLRPLSPAGAQG